MMARPSTNAALHLIFLPLLFPISSLYPTLILAQHITPAPSLVPVANPYHNQHSLLLRRQKASSSYSDSFSALGYCQSSNPGCENQLPLYSACQAEHLIGPDRLYCLCTTGYHEAVRSCEECKISVGYHSARASYLTVGWSLDRKNCESRSSTFRASSNSQGPASVDVQSVTTARESSDNGGGAGGVEGENTSVNTDYVSVGRPSTGNNEAEATGTRPVGGLIAAANATSSSEGVKTDGLGSNWVFELLLLPFVGLMVPIIGN